MPTRCASDNPTRNHAASPARAVNEAEAAGSPQNFEVAISTLPDFNARVLTER
jgi:hypothetical protein